MRESQVIGSKKSKFIIRSKFILRSNFFAAQYFSLHRYYIETTTTDIDKHLRVQLQFCNNSGFIAISDEKSCFAHYWTIEYQAMQDRRGRREIWSYSTCFGNAQSIMHLLFHLYDVLRFDSTVVITVHINIPSPKLNNQFCLVSKLRVHEYASGLTSTPKAELFCSWKRRQFIGQNKVKICKL